MKHIIRLFCLLCLCLSVGCANISYGPLKITSVGTDVAVDSASWVKTYSNGTSEAFTIVGGKRDSSKSVHTLANTSAAIIGAIIGAGTPAGPGIGAAGGISLAEAWQTLLDRTGDPQVALPQNTTPPSVNPVNPANPVPAATLLSDDPACELIVKYHDKEEHNSGQVTYLKRVLTSKPFGTAYPVCVQYNDTDSGEVTVWKEEDNRAPKIDTLPSDRGINKIVVWYEDAPEASAPVQPQPAVVPQASGNNPDFDPSNWPKGWSLDQSRITDTTLVREAAPGEFYGRVTTPDATNVRYRLRSHFEHDLKVQTGYGHKGQVNIVADDAKQTVTWQVM